MANLATINNNILADSGIDPLSVVIGSGTANQIAYWIDADNIGALTTATYPSLTELSYVKGVTSAIQTQINAKQNTLTLTTTGTSGAATLVGSTLNIPNYADVGFANPMTTLGDIIYGAAAGAATRLAGNTTTTKQYLSQTGTGSASAAPAWSAIAGSDVTGAALTKTDDTNVTLTLGGTPATALLRAASLTLGWTGQLSVARGGTGASTAVAAFDNLSPLTTLGDTLFHNGTDNVRLAGNITTTKQFLSQTGTGTVSAAPAWATITGSDVTGAALTKTDDTNVTLTLGGTPATALLRAASITVGWSGSLAVGRGGTGATSLTGVLIGNGTSAITAVAGTANQLLRRNAGNTAYEFFTPTYLTAAITSLNGLTAATQTFATGTTGTDFNISSTTSTHTFNIPNASTANRGLVTTGAQTFGGAKTFDSFTTFNNSVQGSGMYFNATSTGVGNNTLSQVAVLGAANTSVRNFTYLNSTTLTAGDNYVAFTIGTSAITEAASGTSALVSQLVLKPISLTNGAGSTTNGATLYVEGAAGGTATITNNYAVWVDDGSVRIDTLGGAGTRMVVADANGVMSTQVIPSGGITSLNGLTAATQTFATGTSGTDFNISSATSTHTFNIPDASGSARGLITTGTQTIAGAKTFSSNLTLSSTDSVIQGGGSTGTFKIGNSAVNTYMAIYGSSHPSAPNAIEFVNNNDQSLIIYQNGSVSIGATANGDWALAVNNSGTTNANVLYVNMPSTSTGTPFLIQTSGTNDLFRVTNSGAGTFTSSVTASSIIKSGGTAAQILAADGSVITAGTNITISGGTISATASGGMSIGGSITSATAGSVLFAGASGVLAQDNANFFWDDTNNRLGIGTTSPGYTLDVYKSSAIVRIYNTSNPGAEATYSKDLGLILTSYYSASGSPFTRTADIVSNADAGAESQMRFFTATTSSNPTERMRITSGGNVLVGTTTDDTINRLQVNGGVSATNLILGAGTASIAPLDFVAGTLKTTPALGDMEVDSNGYLFYTASSRRGVLSPIQWIANTATRTYTATTTSQNMFDTASAGGNSFAVVANTTYFFEVQINLTALSATANAVGFGLIATGAVISNISYMAISERASTIGTPTAPNMCRIATAAATAVTPSVASATAAAITIKGLLRITTGGNLTPVISQIGATSASVLGIGSYVKFYAVGTNTETKNPANGWA